MLYIFKADACHRNKTKYKIKTYSDLIIAPHTTTALNCGWPTTTNIRYVYKEGIACENIVYLAAALLSHRQF